MLRKSKPRAFRRKPRAFRQESEELLFKLMSLIDFESLKITQTLTTVSVFVRHQHKEGVPFSIKAIRQLESGDTS